jgi:mandelate racemase/muconate lactonizing enzyme-like protein
VLALSALDIALWDLKARRANVPLLRLLGGFDARVPCYAGGIDLDLSVEALLQQTDDNRSTLICCLSTRISASTANRDRNKSLDPKDQSTQILHRVPASPDSQSTASTIEFTTGTACKSTLRAVLVVRGSDILESLMFV